MTDQPTPAEIRLAQYGQRTSTWSTATYNNGTEKALHEIAVGLKEEVDRLRAERDELRGKFADAAASLAHQVQRYGQRQREHNADREELEHLRTVLTQIRHLHKDSPMGPCPVCIDADAIAEGRDGLMPYPCPTGRLAGAQDCDPTAPAARSAANEGGAR